MTCVLCGATQFSVIHTLEKCIHCGLVQVVPMPSEKKIHELYHEDLEHFEPYIAQISVHRAYFRKKIQEIHKRGTLLDIGCAMGILLEEAKKVGFQVQGIDISNDAVAYCRKKELSVYQGTVISFKRRGLTKLNAFDVICAFEVIEHERDPLAMMKRVHTLLKKGGIAVLTTPNHDSFWRKILGKYWVGYHHPEHVTFWGPESLRQLFERAGFRNSTIRRDSPRPFPLSFAFTRSADYFPWAAWFLRLAGKLMDRLKITNPINPWDDLIVYGRK